MTAPDQTALVLSGGGAYGAFSVGVMKVLFAGRSPANSYQPLLANKNRRRLACGVADIVPLQV